MASLADIRKKIGSVKSTQKITKAMKLVAASKLRRAQDRINAVRPYALQVGGLLQRVATSLPTEDGQAAHPLLEVHAEPKNIMLIVLTSDRGLCGGFNMTALRHAEKFIAEQQDKYESITVATIGRKGRDHFKKRKMATVRDFPGVFENLEFRRAQEIAEQITDEYVERDLDAVYILYNEFKSAIRQDLVVQPLLPIEENELPEGEYATEYVFEADQASVLEQLIPRYVAIGIWRAMLESFASEHGARMTAMESATKNAKELVDSLTLTYNRARQAAITRELMEIISGAEALNN